MNWLACNKCWIKFAPSLKFCLLECGHILCGKCFQFTLKSKRCIMCNKVVAAIALGKTMDASTQMFFWPAENILEQALKVDHFQLLHRKILMQGLYNKYNCAKKECIRYYRASKKLDRDRDDLKKLLKFIEENPPRPTPSPLPTTHPSNQSPDTLAGVPSWSSLRITPISEPRPGYATRVINPQIYAAQNMTYRPSMAMHHGQGLATRPASSFTQAPPPSQYQAIPRGYPTASQYQAIPQRYPSPSQYQGIPRGYPIPVHGALNHNVQAPTSHAPISTDLYKNSANPTTLYRRN